MSPSSVLACQDFGVVGASGGGGSGGGGEGWRGLASHRGAGLASRGAAADAGRGDGLLCYGQLMETQRPFVSSVTPLPALQTLLLFSARVDTSEDASLVRSEEGRGVFIYFLLSSRLLYSIPGSSFCSSCCWVPVAHCHAFCIFWLVFVVDLASGAFFFFFLRHVRVGLVVCSCCCPGCFSLLS